MTVDQKTLSEATQGTINIGRYTSSRLSAETQSMVAGVSGSHWQRVLLFETRGVAEDRLGRLSQAVTDRQYEIHMKTYSKTVISFCQGLTHDVRRQQVPQRRLQLTPWH